MTPEHHQSLGDLYGEAFSHMEQSVHELAGNVPAPRLVQKSCGRVFRYEERLPAQAVVLKLARLVSTLRATHLLLDQGFVQEVATLERVIGEIQEDVFFLVTGDEATTPRYGRFLDDFWEEEFDAKSALASTQKRGMTPRQKIRAQIGRFVSQIEGSTADSSRTTEQLRTVDNAQSGYVHGAAPQLMEMYGGSPPRFHMAGMLGTAREQEHGEQFWNYVYRSIFTFAMVTRSFGDSAAAVKIREYADAFERSKPGGATGGGRVS